MDVPRWDQKEDYTHIYKEGIWSTNVKGMKGVARLRHAEATWTFRF